MVHLDSTMTDTLTIDKDMTNLKAVTVLGKELVRQFKRPVDIYRTRRGHYHLEQKFIHSLTANIIIRLLAKDDPYKVQLDTLRMAGKVDLHNQLHKRKMALSLTNGTFQHLRKPRTFVKTITLEQCSRKKSP